MTLHELTPLSKGQSICVLQKIKSKSKSQNREKNVMNIVQLSNTQQDKRLNILLDTTKQKSPTKANN